MTQSYGKYKYKRVPVRHHFQYFFGRMKSHK